MKMYATIEEFAAARRQMQDTAIRRLDTYVTDWLTNPTPETRAALLNQIVLLYRLTYRAEGGNQTPIPTRIADTIGQVLDKSSPDTRPDLLTTLLVVATTNAAIVQAAEDDPEPLLLEWVTMHDADVRDTHRHAEGQQRPAGQTFTVGGSQLEYPGQPVGDPAIWINCRCTLAPVLAATASSVTEPGVTMNTTTGTSFVYTPTYTTTTTNGPVFAPTSTQEPQSVDPAEIPDLVHATPWHGVLAPEDKWSGDGRRFAKDSLSTRELPLPLTWQKASDDGHSGSVVVAKIVRVQRVDGEMRGTGVFLTTPEADEVVGLLADFGKFGVSVDADDAEFEFDEASNRVTFTSARIASASIVSIPAFAEAWVALGEAPDGFLDGDEADPNPGEPTEFKDYTPEQRKGAHTVPGTDSYPIEDCEDLRNAIQAIGRAKDPAATKRHIKTQKSRLGCPDVEIPEGWSDDTDEFGRGPGWITNPADTKRIHDYWTVPGHEGYAKIAWGTPGDFDRCRVEIGAKIAENSPEKVRFINQICSQWHHDATGFWPGKAPAERAASGEPAPAVRLVADAGRKAPAAWFANPMLERATHLTVTDDGRVFGHLAEWGVCHIGFDGVCVVAPESQTGYAYFATGQVALDNGTMARTGVISLGGGHAGRGSPRAAIEHYDSTSHAVADVTVGEDEHGIWCAGWIRPGTTDEQVGALRASDVSGDWREVGGNLELVAALAVNVGGFPVARVEDGIQVMLVAAGVLHSEAKPDPVQDLAERVAAAVERNQRAAKERIARMAELMERVRKDH